MNDNGDRQWFRHEQLIDSFLDGLRTRQRLRVDGDQVKDVAGGTLREELLCRRSVERFDSPFALGEQEPRRKRHICYRVLVD